MVSALVIFNICCFVEVVVCQPPALSGFLLLFFSYLLSIVQAFGTPRNHPKSKPFIDRIMGFYYLDDRIWIRNYQVGVHVEVVQGGA